MINLRLENEYLAGPIFCPDLGNMGHIEVNDLPISNQLKFEIIEWDKNYQATFNSDYPPDSGFGSHEAELLHVAEGRKLAKRLQEELGSGYIIEYRS